MNPELGDTGQDGSIGQPLVQHAVIHIGANAVSMIIVERVEKDSPNVEALEYLEQPLPLAEDIFRDGVLSRSTIERCVKILELLY